MKNRIVFLDYLRVISFAVASLLSMALRRIPRVGHWLRG